MEFNFGDVTILNLALWSLVGIIIGSLFQIIDRRDVRSNPAATVLVGVIGAILGGFVGHLMFGIDINQMELQSLWPSLAGAVLLIVSQKAKARPEDHFKTSVNRLQ